MKLTTRYYVLSLSAHMSRLYEAFRDTLIDIQNKRFPIDSTTGMSDTVAPALMNDELQEAIRTADEHFDHYFKQDPLRLVVVGDQKNLSAFEALTTHRDALIGSVAGDYTATSAHDLGKIVWPIVKKVMAGAGEKAMPALETAKRSESVTSGIDAVGHAAHTGAGGTLFVEEDYHRRGGIRETDDSIIGAEDVDIREVTDDAVDAIIEKVLEKGGNVVFLESGALAKLQRIALVTEG